MLKLLFKMNLDPLGSYNVYMYSVWCLCYGSYIRKSLEYEISKRAFADKHARLYMHVKSYGKGAFLGPDARLHTMGNVFCTMERILDWELGDMGNSPDFSLFLGQVT